MTQHRTIRNAAAARSGELIFLLGADATDEAFEAGARALNEARGIPHPPSKGDTTKSEPDD